MRSVEADLGAADPARLPSNFAGHPVIGIVDASEEEIMSLIRGERVGMAWLRLSPMWL